LWGGAEIGCDGAYKVGRILKQLDETHMMAACKVVKSARLADYRSGMRTTRSRGLRERLGSTNEQDPNPLEYIHLELLERVRAYLTRVPVLLCRN
jgi:hypothetical protein